MSKYTKEDIKAIASGLCGIDSDSEGVAAINRAIDFLTELAEGESDEVETISWSSSNPTGEVG